VHVYLTALKTQVVSKDQLVSERTKEIIVKKLLLVLMLGLASYSAPAATWYVDNTATGSNDGTSWANAWKSIAAIAGVSAGDTVYFSGGPTASSQTYMVPTGGWTPAGGTAGHPITYQTAQDSSHNGNVILTAGGNEFLIVNPKNNVTLSGYVGQAFNCMSKSPVVVQHMQFGLPKAAGNWDATVYCNTLGQSNNLTLAYIYVPGCNRFVYIGNGLKYGCTGLKVNNCFSVKLFFPTPGALDDSIYLGGLGGVAFADGAVFHDNFIRSPCNGNQGTAIGDDVFKWGGNMDLYHNHIQLYLNDNYTFSPNFQHADVLQNNATSTRVYDNWFENIGESIWFHDSLAQSAYADLQFYNNVITQNFPSAISAVARGLDFEPQDNGKSTFTNVLIANNTWNVPSLFVMRFVHAASWKNVRVVNNAYWECNDASKSSWDATAGFEIKVSNNLTAKKSDFLAAKNDSNDFALAPGAREINAGVSLSSFFTTDFVGTARRQWDIGAYAYAPGSPPPKERRHQPKASPVVQ
jgi:hypothetical protein